MKSEFKSKFLQHLASKKKDEGFTLIELLVVIIIIGILAAIALPSFLNQAAKAKQSEAKNTIGAAIRAQQAYRLSKPTFATNFTDLVSEVAIVSETPNYTFNMAAGTSINNEVVINALPKDATTLKKYQGRVLIIASGASAAAACEANKPGDTPVASVNSTTGVAGCVAPAKLLGEG